MIRKKENLRIGYTTGTNAAAAAKGAVMGLKGQAGSLIEIALPGGKKVSIVPHRTGRRGDTGFCEVIKDAGDDPDVTNGALIRAAIRPIASKRIIIKGGAGVGRVTRPGLAVLPGKPAINPVPKSMILQAINDIRPSSQGFEVTISVEGGAEIARKTLNPRLGIVDGISILGTTGLVIPYSHDAYRESIRCALDVVKATGLQQVVLCTGRGSEKGARKVFQDLPEAAFVLMADYFSFAVAESVRHNMQKVVVACFFGKLLKMAAGAHCTHYRQSSLDLDFLAGLAQQAGLEKRAVSAIRRANTARHALHFIAAKQQGRLFSSILGLVLRRIREEAGNATRAEVLLLSYDGEVLGHARDD